MLEIFKNGRYCTSCRQVCPSSVHSLGGRIKLMASWASLRSSVRFSLPFRPPGGDGGGGSGAATRIRRPPLPADFDALVFDVVVSGSALVLIHFVIFSIRNQLVLHQLDIV